MTKPSNPLNLEARDHLLQDPKYAMIYLEECLADGDIELFQAALKEVAKAQGGMKTLAENTNLGRESLYKSLSKKGKPQLETVFKVLSALGLRFSITQANET